MMYDDAIVSKYLNDNLTEYNATTLLSLIHLKKDHYTRIINLLIEGKITIHTITKELTTMSEDTVEAFITRYELKYKDEPLKDYTSDEMALHTAIYVEANTMPTLTKLGEPSVDIPNLWISINGTNKTYTYGSYRNFLKDYRDFIINNTKDGRLTDRLVNFLDDNDKHMNYILNIFKDLKLDPLNSQYDYDYNTVDITVHNEIYIYYNFDRLLAKANYMLRDEVNFILNPWDGYEDSLKFYMEKIIKNAGSVANLETYLIARYTTLIDIIEANDKSTMKFTFGHTIRSLYQELYLLAYLLSKLGSRDTSRLNELTEVYKKLTKIRAMFIEIYRRSAKYLNLTDGKDITYYGR